MQPFLRHTPCTIGSVVNKEEKEMTTAGTIKCFPDRSMDVRRTRRCDAATADEKSADACLKIHQIIYRPL